MKGLYLLLFIFTTTQPRLFSQVSIDLANLSYAQNFDSYEGSQASLPLYWNCTTGNFRGLGTGSSTTGGAYAFYSGNSSERAAGGLHSNSNGNVSYSVSFVNNSGIPVVGLDISYVFEQYRNGGSNATGFNVSVSGLPQTAAAALSQAYTAVGQDITKSINLTGLFIAPGAGFAITWTTDDQSGSENGIALDDFQLTAYLAPPELAFSADSLTNFSCQTSLIDSAGLSGRYLLPEDSSITVNSPANYSVSLSIDGPYTDSLRISYQQFTLPDTRIFFRLNNNYPVQDTATVFAAGPGIADTIALREIYNAPQFLSDSLSLDFVFDDRALLSWNPGTASGQLIFLSTNPVLPELPRNGVNYAADSVFMVGDTLSQGFFAVGNYASDSTAWIHGLNPQTVYYAWIFDYNNQDSCIIYSALSDSLEFETNKLGVVQLTTLQDTVFCRGALSELMVSGTFETFFPFPPTSEFQLVISDAAGSFADSTLITTVSGTFQALLPGTLSESDNYLIRIQSTDPYRTSNPVSVSIVDAPGMINLLQAAPLSQQVDLTWENPAGCYERIVVVCSEDPLQTDTITGNPGVVNSNLYFDLSNPAIANGRLVFDGLQQAASVSGLQNDSLYYFTVFTYFEGTWSDTTVVRATPVDPSSINKTVFHASPVLKNPVRDRIEFSVQPEFNVETIRLFDSVGNLARLYSKADIANQQLNVSDLVPGIYFLEVSDGHKQVFTKKLAILN